MLRFQSVLASFLGAALVLPAVLGQGELATLESALQGTARALEVLRGIEQRLADDPAGALVLLLSATEGPSGDERERDERLERLRSEVNLLQMELDALESPLTDASGAVTGALGTREPPAPTNAPLAAGVTTGLDDSLRALLAQELPLRGPAGLPGGGGPPAPGAVAAQLAPPPAPREEAGYSADPLRHGIACYRARRFPEALALFEQLPEGASALYWRARTLERLERLDEAILLLERALALGEPEFELRRAQTDLEFLRWKRDFLATLPGAEEPR